MCPFIHTHIYIHIASSDGSTWLPLSGQESQVESGLIKMENTQGILGWLI